MKKRNPTAFCLNERATAALSGWVSMSACSQARKMASCPLWSNFNSLDSIFMPVGSGCGGGVVTAQFTGVRAWPFFPRCFPPVLAGSSPGWRGAAGFFIPSWAGGMWGSSKPPRKTRPVGFIRSVSL